MVTFDVRSCVVLAALALAGSFGCNREPYLLGPDDVVGDRFPDEDIDLERERADPGHELYIPPEGTPMPEHRPCTKEEIEQHIAENTRDDGSIEEIGIFCLKNQPPPPVAASAPK
jgi:hypothetical protein